MKSEFHDALALIYHKEVKPAHVTNPTTSHSTGLPPWGFVNARHIRDADYNLYNDVETEPTIAPACITKKQGYRKSVNLEDSSRLDN